MKCTAHRTDGHPCQAKAIKGGTVCRVHGGSAPQVKAKAMQRLLQAADPAAAQLVELALRGGTESVKLQAIRDLLDRAGLQAAQKIEAEVTHHDGDSDLDREIERLLETMASREESSSTLETDSKT